MFGDKMDVQGLKDMGSYMNDGAYFMMTKGNTFTYFIIKNNPLMSYTFNKNDIISDRILGNKAAVLNNICGKIDFTRGMYATMRF